MVVSSALIISGCCWGSDRFALLPRFSGHFFAEDGGYFALHKSPRDVGARQRAVLSARAVNLHQRKISARLVAWFAWEMAAEASGAAVDVRLRPCLPLGAIYGGGGGGGGGVIHGTVAFKSAWVEWDAAWWPFNQVPMEK